LLWCDERCQLATIIELCREFAPDADLDRTSI
jgi:hypothetical protein